MGNANSGKKGDQADNGKNVYIDIYRRQMVILSQEIYRCVQTLVDRWWVSTIILHVVFFPSISNQKSNIGVCTRPI
jgi:hypothetical protein